MAFVDDKVKEYRANGIFSAQRVDPDIITRIVNMEEWEYYGTEIPVLESYLGLLSQQVMFLQQEVNIAEAKEIELGNAFKMEALPQVVASKIRSVEERWIFATTINDGLRLKFEIWQQAIIEATLKNKLANPVVEKLNVLKKIYDDRRLEGNNKNLHKYNDGK